MNFEVGLEYRYKEILDGYQEAEDNLMERGGEMGELEMTEYGPDLLGKNAIHIMAPDGKDYWFIWSSFTRSGSAFYKCVYIA